MAWEKRSNGRHYYYRSRRVNGRVVKEYVGGPGIGNYVEQVDANHRARRDAERQATRDMADALDASERPLVTLEEVTSAMIVGVLEAAGLHQHHRGEWRKRRATTTQRR